MTKSSKAAVAAGVVGSEETLRALLASVVEVARAIFGAKASSIFLLDEEADELVFEAVAGEGADTLLGQRFPSSTGIAGWVLVTRQPLVIEDVTEDPRFAQGLRRGDRLRPEGPDGGAAPATRSARSACSRCSTGRSARSSRSSRWTCSGCSRTRPRSRSTCCGARDGPRRFSPKAAAAPTSSPGSPTTVENLEDERREDGIKLLAALDAVLRRDEGG